MASSGCWGGALCGLLDTLAELRGQHATWNKEAEVVYIS